MFLWWIPWCMPKSWVMVFFIILCYNCKQIVSVSETEPKTVQSDTINRTFIKNVENRPWTVVSGHFGGVNALINSVQSDGVGIDDYQSKTQKEANQKLKLGESNNVFIMPNVTKTSFKAKCVRSSKCTETFFTTNRNNDKAIIKSKLKNKYQARVYKNIVNNNKKAFINQLLMKAPSDFSLNMRILEKTNKNLSNNSSDESRSSHSLYKRSINEYKEKKLVSPSKSIVGLADPIANLGPGLPRRSKELPIEDKEGMGGSALNPSTNSNHQRFATQPAPQTAVIGSTAVLPCRVMRKVGHLQWTKNGFGLGTDRKLQGFTRYSMIGSNDEGDFTLRIHPVLLQDDAIYQCQVSASDRVPGIQTKPIKLTVYVPPDSPEVIPPELKTTAGVTEVVQCLSKGGRPASEIQWVDDSLRETIQLGAAVSVEPMPDGKRTIVTSKLTFSPKRRHNNQTLTCLASNQAQSAPLTASIRMQVFFPPDVTLTSHPDVFVEGDNAVFHCDSVANPSTATYRWFHNTQEMANETTRKLKLFKISRDFHQDSISCEVTNKVGASKKTKTIYVRYRPTFRMEPKDVKAELGANVELVCDVDSNPTASIIWLKPGSDKIIGSGASLQLEVSAGTAGLYKCLASVRGRDFEFPKLEGRVQVLVKGPPKIVSKSEQQGRMGDTVSLECRTVSIPSPLRVTWSHLGRGIDLNDPRYSVINDAKDTSHRNVLVIHEAETTDFGDYNCSVVNEYGVDMKRITLKEEQQIPVLLVVGLVVAITVITVIVVSLVFCNKSHPPTKGTTSEQQHSNKDKTTVEESFTPVTNMYSAHSDTKLDDSLIGTPVQVVPLTEVKIAPIPPKRNFAKDDTNLAFNNMRQHNINGFSSPTKAQRETLKNDYTSFMDSLSDGEQQLHKHRGQSNHSPYLGGHPLSPQGGAGTMVGVSEFCTIRRTPRLLKQENQHLQQLNKTSSVLNQNIIENNGSTSNRIHHQPFPQQQKMIINPVNGNLLPSSHHNVIGPTSNRRSTSVYSPNTYNSSSTSQTQPQPPPYPMRNNHHPLAISESDNDSKREYFEGDGASSNEEAKYIFSSEAMLKPGTLV